MKLYYLLGLFLVGVVSCRHLDDQQTTKLSLDDGTNKLDTDNSEETWFVDPKSTTKFAEKCKEIGGEAAAKKFILSVDKTAACLNNEVPKTQSALLKEFDNERDEESDTICSKKRKTFRGCFVDIIDALKDCSREEEKYAPDFVFDAIDATLDFVCGENAKVVNDVINANETTECVEHLIEKVFSGNMTWVCTENFKLLNSNEDDIITKPELCSDLLTAKTCYSAFLTRECPKATELNSFLVGAFNAISSPCRDVQLPITLPAISNKGSTLSA